MPRQFRRVVTGFNSGGKSIIWKDGPPPQSLEPLPQLILHEVWETGSPASNAGDEDLAIRENRIEPHHPRSEEHTSELQSQAYLVCRLLLEKKKHTNTQTNKQTYILVGH